MQERKYDSYSTIGFMDKCQTLRRCTTKDELNFAYKSVLEDLAFREEICDITDREYRLFCYWASLVYDDVIQEIHFDQLFRNDEK